MLRRSQKQTPLTNPTEFPSGTFVHSEKGWFFIKGPGKRYRISTKRCLDSWAPPRVVETTEESLKSYRIVAKMKFRNGSLIHNLADGKIYLIADAKRRHITSPDVFARIGAVGTRKDVTSVSLAEILLHEEGEPLI